MADKLVNRKDIMDDLINNVAPNYFPEESLDKNRVSVFGYLTEAIAKSVEDTITLEQRRAEDYCPELSNSLMRVRQTAQIRNVEINAATPGIVYAVIGILKSDIIEKGTQVGNEIQFTIDRRSTITNGNVGFSLEDDILIRAVKKGSTYVYAANYTGENPLYNTYIQLFEQDNDQGEPMVALMLQIYQYRYNIQEKVVTDSLEFMYDGVSFDYDDKLAGFEVYYKQSQSDDYTHLSKSHYLSPIPGTNDILYNSDDDNILYILNNESLNIGVNATLRVEIRETLGSDGMVLLGNESTSFQLYRDGSYNYTGVNIIITLLSDVTAAADGDTITDIKTRLIDAKSRRDNITTDVDILNYIDDVDANVQILKKRNDIQDRNYYMYTLLRNNSEIVPTTTKKLIVQAPAPLSEELEDFDIIDRLVGSKIIRANARYKLTISQVAGYDYDMVERVTEGEVIDPDGFYLTCPYMIMVNNLNILSYYFTSVDTSIRLNTKSVNDVFPYQAICRNVSIYRNSHDDVYYDTYTFTIKATLNTANDDAIVKDGVIIDKTMIVPYIIFKCNGANCAYLPMEMTDYSTDSREFTFVGKMHTNDYITESGHLQITGGMYYAGSSNDFDSVIDYKDASFEIYFMYKEPDPNGVYTKTGPIYAALPADKYTDYVVMNGYYNTASNPYNLILELNKVSKSPVSVRKKENTDTSPYLYTLNEVPFLEYTYGRANIIKLYSEIARLTNVYTSMLTLTTDFEISLKFIATYGHSKYITITGGRDPSTGAEYIKPLNNLNPIFYFKIYGMDVPVEEIREYIRVYLRDTYIIGNTVFISNICTAVEKKFTSIKSIKYLGVDTFDASYQELTYNAPVYTNVEDIMNYVPEHLNASNIVITIDET